MSNALTAEYRLLTKAQKFIKGELPPENQKSAKLLSRVAKTPDQWLSTYKLFNDLTWASEVFLLGLNNDEQKALVSMLKSMEIYGIRLSSSEGYKALAVAAMKEHQRIAHEQLNHVKHELELDLKAVIRYDHKGIVVSGYKRGWPFTTYIGTNDHYHKLYLEDLCRFETVARATESKLGQQDDLRYALYKVERALPKIRESWKLWQQEEVVKTRLDNLEKYSDTGGALL